MRSPVYDDQQNPDKLRELRDDLSRSEGNMGTVDPNRAAKRETDMLENQFKRPSISDEERAKNQPGGKRGGSGGDGNSTDAAEDGGGRSPFKKGGQMDELMDRAGGFGNIAGQAGGMGRFQAALKLGGAAREAFLGNKKRRRATAGTGITGVIIAAVFFGAGMMSGPFQLIHMGEVLEQAHDSTQQDQDETRLTHNILVAKAFATGQGMERTRLGILGNRLTDSFERDLKRMGYTSAYTERFGLFNGLIIDEKHPQFAGKTTNQIMTHMKQQYGVTVIDGDRITTNAKLKGTLVVEAENAFKQKRFTRQVMREAGLRKLVSRIGARFMCIRNACNSLMHPIKKADAALQLKAEDWLARRAEKIKKGDAAQLSTTDGSQSDDEDGKSQNASDAKTEADGVLEEGKEAAGKPGGIAGFRNSLVSKLANGKSAFIIAVACTLRGIAAEADTIKQEQVIQPLQRQNIDYKAVPSQMKAGMDSTLKQYGPYEDMMYGENTEGKMTSAFAARSIQAAMNRPMNGPAPDATLTTIAAGTPFDFLSQGAVGAAMAGACSTVVQGGLIVISFLGGPITTVVGVVVGVLAGGPVMNAAAHWLSGEAVESNPVGSDLGYALSYGGRLAANDQALASGGRPLSDAEKNQIAFSEQQMSRQEFAEKSFVARIFDLSDSRSVASGFIDGQSPDMKQNVANAITGIPNIASSISRNFSSIFFAKSGAMAEDYDYGIPKEAMSQAEMDDARYDNPYINATRVADLLDSSRGGDYIAKAQDCLGDSIAKNADGQWDVTTSVDASPTYKQLQEKGCYDTGDQNWTDVRFFVRDTVVIKAYACYQNDAGACVDVGFGDQPVGDSGGTTPVSGDVKSLAQQIIDSPNISFQSDREKLFEEVAKTGTQQACGEAIPISPTLLAVILQASQKYKIVLGVFAASHGCDSGFHPKGMAVDINGVAKLDNSVTTGNFLHFYELNGTQLNLVRQFYGDLGDILAQNGGGGLGQVTCTPNLPKKTGVIYFEDSCDHLHMDVGKRT